MRKFIVYNEDGVIVKYGSAQNKDVALQAEAGQHIRIVSQMVSNFDLDHRVENGPFGKKIVRNIKSQKIIESKALTDKTFAEIERDNPPPPVIPDEDRPARMTKKELAHLMQRVKDLEDKATGNP